MATRIRVQDLPSLDATLRARAPLTPVQCHRAGERTDLRRVTATHTMPRTRMQPPLHLLVYLILVVCACCATASAAALSAHERGPLSHQQGMALLRAQLRMARTENAQLRSWLARVHARSRPAAGASTGGGCGSGAAARVVRTAVRVQHTHHRADVWGSAAGADDGNSSTRAAARAAHGDGMRVGGGTVQHVAHRAVQLAQLRVSRRQEEVAWLEQAIRECDATEEHAVKRGGRSSGTAAGSRANVPRPGGGFGMPGAAPRLTRAPTSRVPVSERQALVSLFSATNGDDWVDNRLWGSPAPVCNWSGVTCNPNHTHVVAL